MGHTVQFFSGYHGGRPYIAAHVSPLKLIEIWSGSYEGGYRVRDRIHTLLSRSPLSVQAALADPRGPEVGLRELAAKFMEQIENE
jgi:hypothetical protein